MDDRKLHVVLGTGPLGLAVARQLTTTAAQVRVVNRAGRADVADSVEVVAANVAEVADAKKACAGAAVVYHCANPPYAKWPELHRPLMASIVEGAAAIGATLVFGDNLYGYGPVAGPLTEDLPSRARGPNGRVRAEIAEDLLRAHRAGRVRVAIGRGSDFFGPHAHLSTVGDGVFARAIAGKPAQVLGNADLPHTVTYIDDFARALVTLGERDEALGQVWHVPNAPTVSLRRFVEMVFQAAGHPPRLRRLPGWMLAPAALFSPTLRAVREQRYQRERPWVVDSSKFERAFGQRGTPLPDAIAATVGWFRQHTSSKAPRQGQS
ncbi:MAG: NAD-dependent epimerase/dehydratase family protein [Jiangellaceae bacterium]|nr:NAD-dependent epimerase/dehydratase family protein [Jiangellaceae bacterium]